MSEAKIRAQESAKYPYSCGYDPRGKSLKETVQHWASCKSSQCQTMHARWPETKALLTK